MKLFDKPLLGPNRVVTEAAQAQTFSRRATLLGAIQGGVAMLIAGRMTWISVAENEHYALLSESNRVSFTWIPPRRGWIIDRYGKPLANNKTDFRVDLIPGRLKDKDKDRVVGTLAQLLGLTPDDVARINEDLQQAAGFQPVQVADGLTYDQYAAISVRLSDLPGAAPARGYSRFYPGGATVGHLIGYVGIASAQQYKESKNPLLITPGFKVGKEGLERTFEDRLTGKPGAKRVEKTMHGKIVRELTMRPDTPGGIMRLTIDAGLQEYTARRMGDQSAAAVVMDATNGDILCFASMPSYDPNSFSDGISHAEWGMMSSDERHPLINKVLQGLYPPGSTCKPMMAVALLKSGIDPMATINCQKAWRYGNATFHCSGGPHGPIAMHEAIARSCDIYFYQMALQAGVQVISPLAKEFGMGERFDLPFPSQRYGTWPDPEWLMRRRKRAWQGYDTINMSIGQGDVQVNPLQQAVMVSRIISGRKVMPRIVSDGKTPQFAQLEGVDPAHLDIVRSGMVAVVNGGGTAHAFRLPVPELMAGKTGTAQVRNIGAAERAGGVRSNASLAWRLRDHSWFICYAPAQAPRYAACFLVEHGGFGAQAAAPLAKDVMTYLFDREPALKSLEAMEKQWGGPAWQRMAADLEKYKAQQAMEAAIARGEIAAPANAADGNVANGVGE